MSYKIVVTADAHRDLEEALQYITDTLGNPTSDRKPVSQKRLASCFVCENADFRKAPRLPVSRYSVR